MRGFGCSGIPRPGRGGKRATQVALDKRAWIRSEHFLGNGQVKHERQEIIQLRREVAKLKAKRDILKKAAAYFAREAI